MIEISGARLVFYGQTDQVLATVEVPVRLETLGQVTLIVEPWVIPVAAREAACYQISLPMPVIYAGSEIMVWMVSRKLEIRPVSGAGGGEG
jgi:hypothetical protein